MCGISGILTDNDSLNIQEIVYLMTEKLRHRGPNDIGHHFQKIRGGVLGLGNTRLSILDLTAAGHQPMLDTPTGNRIVYNGEIYNFLDLKHLLKTKGHTFTSGTDTEMILKAYSEWGIECIHRFRGMFSFALWDEQKNLLYLVRDRLGVKPLYYYQQQGLLMFASEVRALLASGCISKELSPEGLDSYLALGGVRDPWTIIHQVFAMPAGCFATYQDTELKITSYWHPPNEIDEQYTDWKREKIIQQLREKLTESVQLRLVSDVPLGIFLSGGVDSSSIVSLATDGLKQAPHTVSIIFNERDYSEAGSIQLVARHYQTRHSEVLLTSSEMVNILPQALAAMDQPTFDGINTYFVSKAARETGLTVVLSGIGGDEVFGGYPSFRWTPLLEKFRATAPSWLGQLVRTALKASFKNNSRTYKIVRWLESPQDYPQAYSLIRELFSPDNRQLLIPGLPPAVGNMEAGLISQDKFNQVSILELTDYLRNIIVRDSDCMSMAHSLELREPFLDHQLVEFLLSLPGNIKSKGNVPKSLLVEAIGNLPPEIIHRKKQVFHLPFKHWLGGSLKPELEDILLNPNSLNPRFFNPETTGIIWNNFLEGKTSWVRPWYLYVLQKWISTNLQS
ncbi:MAG: asparagine synthase (glutamine-hydrolyzing) [Anaerolineaceae bacterium]|nr:asparagine synthase (glutamine-hydrolyzing) [Anaerolineaceae bacterium]